MSEKPDPSVPVDATLSLGEQDLTRALAADAGIPAPAAGTPGAESAAAPREFATVRITREIGRGAMGVVYLGHDRVLGRDVALKALVNVASAAAREDASSAFLREARAAAAVRHPNLTQIHHADVAPDGIPFLVMEYVDGPSLAQLLRQSAPLSPALVLSILADVCAAVEALHERDIVHRDLKPSNILLDLGGEVYVTDFGLAVKRSASSGAAPERTVAGTPLYMAPEMFEGQVSPRSDIYALGIMAFELLCGHVPFSGSLDEVQRGHAEEALPSHELRARGVSEQLIDLIERATHKKAMFRHKTARELSRALQEVARTIDGTATAKFDLRRLILRPAGVNPVEPRLSIAIAPTSAANSTSYMETLSQIAAVKRERRMRLLDPPGGGAPAAPDAPEAVMTVEERPLEMDVPCVRCAYNLRGLPGRGTCPGCGNPIPDSLSRDRLIFADQQWLRIVTAGVTTIAWGVAAVTLLYIFFAPAAFLVTWIASRGAPAATGVAAVNFLLAPLFSAVFLGGAFALTAREPLRPSAVLPWHLRWIIRAAATLTCLSTTLSALLRGPDWVMNPTLRPLFEIPAFVAIGATMFYLAWLARRVPDPKLAGQARRRAWIILALALPLVLLEILLSFAPVRGLVPRLFVLPSFLLLGLTALAVAMLWLTFRVRKVLRDTLARLVPPARLFETGSESGAPS